MATLENQSQINQKVIANDVRDWLHHSVIQWQTTDHRPLHSEIGCHLPMLGRNQECNYEMKVYFV